MSRPAILRNLNEHILTTRRSYPVLYDMSKLTTHGNAVLLQLATDMDKMQLRKRATLTFGLRYPRYAHILFTLR